jgi:nucleotide-binding universal stress UspA family protein
MYDRILVPTDGSPGMDSVVAHAASLAEVHGATLDFVYVVNTAAFANLPMETSWEGLCETLRDEGEAALDAAAESAGDVPHERHLLEGGPSREITAYATRSDADLVVMGTHGRGGIDRILLGSVAERVVRSSSVPVLTVRVGEPTDDADAEREAQPPTDEE